MTPENLLQQRKPETYAAAAVLARELGKQMMERLEWMRLQPTVIVELGCNTGECTQLLKQRYPDSELIAIDAAESMLHYAKQQTEVALTWLSAAPTQLPLQTQSVDLLVVNLLLPWYRDLAPLLQEWRRVLRPNGLLMLTSLGPDTLQELTAVTTILPHFIDMHDLGDALVAAQFADPVLDIDYLTMTYREQARLIAELQATSLLAATIEPFPLQQNAQQVYPLTYEVIFAHAFAPPATIDHVADATGTVRIPLAHLRAQKIKKSL